MTENSYVTLTESNFQQEVLQSDTPVLVDFWAPWCGPCRALARSIEELAGEFAGVAKIGKVNVDEQQSLAVQYGVHSIPSLLFFRDGKVVDQSVGAVPKKVLSDKLESLSQAA